MEEDPKDVAKRERGTPQVEQLLRQFSGIDGPKGVTPEYRRNWARVFGRKTNEHSGTISPGTWPPGCGCDDRLCWCHHDLDLANP